jgi:hypothetical protein
MKRRRGRSLLALTAGLGALVIAGEAARIPASADDGELLRPFTPSVSMETDRRLAPEEFARQAGLAPERMREQVGASGLVRCGAATGSGQLTGRNDVITTAAHVLIDQFGKRRVGCVFEPMFGAERGPVPLDYDSITTGSSTPLSQPATRDWAVARLVAPVPQATAYTFAAAPSVPAPVFMCAGGNREFAAIGMENCTARRIIGQSPEGIREFALDCNAGPGSSGAALISGNKIVGIYVGYRSNNPQKAQAFSERHYNFAISIEGPFRRALLSAVGQ